MSGMEPEVKKFFSRIVSSLSVGLLWLVVNSTLGIYFNLAFFRDSPGLGNYIFYGWFVISLVLLLLFFKKKWDL